MPAELPPKVTSLKYLVGRDEYGDEKVIEIPAAASILGYDGTNVRFLTGATGQEIGLGDIPISAFNIPLDGVIGTRVSDGKMNLAWSQIFVKRDGIRYHPFVRNGLPGGTTAKDLIVRDGTTPSGGFMAIDPTPIGEEADELAIQPTYIGGVQGIPYINSDRKPRLLSTLDVPAGKVLTMTGSGLAFASPSGLSNSAGAGATGLADVFATSLSNTTVNVKVPKITAADVDGNTTALVGVDLTLATSAVGALGLDVAGPSASSFYYIYVIAKADGTLSLTASLNPSTPVLPTDYIYWAFASLMYIESTGFIRQYHQQGRRFWIKETTYALTAVITETFAAVAGTVGLATILPPIVKMASGRMGGSANETAFRRLLVASNTAGLAVQAQAWWNNGGGTIEGFRYHIWEFRDLPILAPSVPVILWRSDTAANTGKLKMTITGFTI